MLYDETGYKFRSNSLLPSRAKSANILTQSMNYGNPVSNFGNDNQYFNASNNSSFTNIHDILRAKNTAERISDLERTNLKLRRMINYASIDTLNRPDTASLIETDRDIRYNLSGPPVLRQGRLGSSWRHIKQTNNYSNSNLLFVDGTVRIDDSTRYPPRLYGYPPKGNLASHRMLSAATSNRNTDDSRKNEFLGIGARSLTELGLPVNNSIVRNRPHNLNQYENEFQTRAKEGYEYWSKDRRYPENNKPKAKLYTTGAYKTFHGLSDSLLKT